MIASWIGWKIIGGFAKSAFGFVLAQWKWIVIAAIGAILLWGVMKIYGAFAERASLLLERKQKIDVLAQDLTIATVEAQSAQLVIKAINEDRERLRALAANTVNEQKAIRAEASAQKQIFEKHDFAADVKAKPEIIERKANVATQERFDALETAFN
jgi:hypothetical protein